ncbi:MAG: pilus assembly protein PilM [Geobacteraceae bacterium]|nr:pilus assembly protein PilM [Geobacteraceae bacterium]
MLFSQSSIGMEIRPDGVTCAMVTGSQSAPRIERLACAKFPENTVRISLKEQNVLEPAVFIERVKSAHNLLLARTGKVSVSLPDSVGRMLLVDLEGRFKSRAEALDLIRWKLKKSIPFDLSDTQLDYQKLAVRENGEMSLLVALISKTVVSQYEELLVEAGLVPARIDFNSFNLCRVFDRHLAIEGDSIMISYYGCTLGIMAFSQGMPEFIRVKDLSGTVATDSRVFMEINSSLMVCKNRFPDRQSRVVFCMAEPELMQDFREMVEEATGAVATPLETKSVVIPGNAAPGDKATMYAYTAAIGAAMRNL